MEIKIYCLVLLYIDILVQVSAVIVTQGFQSCLHEYSDTNDVLIINELKHVKFDTGMKLYNIIWMIFGMPTLYTVGTDGSMLYGKYNI